MFQYELMVKIEQFAIALQQLELMFFSILGNKIAKNMKLFEEIDCPKSWGVLCQL
jgi:hypothetical protein